MNTMLIPAALIILGLAPARTATAQVREAVVVFDSHRESSTCGYCRWTSPAQVHTWQDWNGNGSWDWPVWVDITPPGHTGTRIYAREEPLTWTVRQQLWIDGVEWQLVWTSTAQHQSDPTATAGWWWKRPGASDTAPRYTVQYVPGYPTASYRVPSGDWWPAFSIETAAGPMHPSIPFPPRPITFRMSHATLGGGMSTQQYDSRYPGVYGSCSLGDQPSGAVGWMVGFADRMMPFRAWSWDEWRSGVIVFGPNPYRDAADLNGDGLRTVGDIHDFLGRWCVGHPRADCNRDGAVDEGDIFDFLAAWFAA